MGHIGPIGPGFVERAHALLGPVGLVDEPGLSWNRLFKPLFKVAGVVGAHVFPQPLGAMFRDPIGLARPSARRDEYEHGLIAFVLRDRCDALGEIAVGLALDPGVDAELPAGEAVWDPRRAVRGVDGAVPAL